MAHEPQGFDWKSFLTARPSPQRIAVGIIIILLLVGVIQLSRIADRAPSPSPSPSPGAPGGAAADNGGGMLGGLLGGNHASGSGPVALQPLAAGQ